MKKSAILLLFLLAGAAAAQTRKIVVTGQFLDQIAHYQNVLPEVKVVAARTPEEQLREIVDADAIFGTITPALMKAAQKL